MTIPDTHRSKFGTSGTAEKSQTWYYRLEFRMHLDDIHLCVVVSRIFLTASADLALLQTTSLQVRGRALLFGRPPENAVGPRMFGHRSRSHTRIEIRGHHSR